VAAAPSLALGPEPAVRCLRAADPRYPPADRLLTVILPDAVQQSVRALRAHRRMAVPALSHPAVRPGEVVDQVSISVMPPEVIKWLFPVTHGSKLYQLCQPCLA
jgi:hypothetical protein